MRRIRRTRMGQNRNAVVKQLVTSLRNQPKDIVDISNNNTNKVFGRLINRWINEDRESVQDIYVDEEAISAVNYAINIIKKELREGN